jgi:Tfp pilus assembly protein PilO
MFNTIASIALLLISLGVSVVYIVPQYHDIVDLRGRDAALNEAIAKTQDIDKTSRDLSEKMRSISKENLDRLERLLPAQFDELRFVNDLQGIADRNGLNIKDIKIEDSKSLGQQPVTPGVSSPSGYVTHKFSFSVSAPYDTFITFLKSLERSLEFIDITSITLSGSSGSGGKQSTSGSFDYRVDFVTYSLK